MPYAKGVDFFSSIQKQKILNKVFKLIKVKSEKYFSELLKKLKANALSLDLGLKMENSVIYLLKKMYACATRRNFFLVTTKRWAKLSSLSL